MNTSTWILRLMAGAVIVLLGMVIAVITFQISILVLLNFSVALLFAMICFLLVALSS